MNSMDKALETPIARIDDPASSHAAAHAITESGTREAQLKAILHLVEMNPGKTSLELSRISKILDRYQIARRLPELARAGLIVRGGMSISSRPAVTWWPR